MSKIPGTEKCLLFKIFDAYLILPMCGDRLLNLENDIGVAKHLSMRDSVSLNKTLNDSLPEKKDLLTKSFKQIIVPDIAPDSLFDLYIDTKCAENIVTRLTEISESDE